MRSLRRSPWIPVGLAAAATTVLAACELLVGDVQLAICTPTGNECEVLNVRDGLTAGSCPHWGCNAQQHCVKSSDADGDGHNNSACGGDDCDDSSPTAFPGGMEVCNGVDDDCNGLIDDNHYLDESGTVVMTTAAPGNARYSAGVPGRSAVLFRSGAMLQGSPLAGAMAPNTAHAPIAVQLATNDRGTSGSTDGLETLAATGVVRGGACTVWGAQGSPTCTDDSVCLRDHGACIVQDGGCTLGPPLSADLRCYDVTHPDAGAGADGGVVLVANDSKCRQQDHCVHAGCVPATRGEPELSTGPGMCSLDGVAVDHVSDTELVLAGIDIIGCAAGALRVYTGGTNLMEAAALGPEARSNVYLGVDVAPGMDYDAGFPDLGPPDGAMPTTGSRCTGWSRTDFRFGASSPSVAALHGTTTPSQALVTYLARETNRLPACTGGAPAPVSAMAVFVEDTGLELPTLMGSNGGVPQDLGHTSGVAPAAVASIDGMHYAVAFPDADMAGMVGLWVLPAATAPSPYMRFVPSDGGLLADGGVPPDGTIPMVEVSPWATRPAPALALPAAAALHLPVGSNVDHVALAVGPALTGGGVRIGVAWQEGCDAMLGGAVKFAIVNWTPTSVTMSTAPVDVSMGTSSAAGPSLVYVADGFVTPGWQRMAGSGPAADANSDGGWLVSFVAQVGGARHSMVVRASELDGQLLPEMAQDTSPTGNRVSNAALYSEAPGDGARAAYATVDGLGMVVTGGTLMCVRGGARLDGGI